MFADNYIIDTVKKINAFVSSATVLTTVVLVRQDNYAVNGQSIMGLYSLDLSRPIIVEFENQDECTNFRYIYESFLKNIS